MLTADLTSFTSLTPYRTGVAYHFLLLSNIHTGKEMSTQRRKRKSRSNNGNVDETTSSSLPEHIQRRNRSIADREASRLARPERSSVQILGHASRSKSAVSSTPFGFASSRRQQQEEQVEANASSSSSEWCGPFSVARQMIAAREAARKKRDLEQDDEGQREKENHPLDAMVQVAEWEKKRKAHPSITWKSRIQNSKADENGSGRVENLYHKRMKRYRRQKQNKVEEDIGTARIEGGMNVTRSIPSLYDKCVKFLVENFEHVEALGPMVDSSIRRSICNALVAEGKMNGVAFDTLAEEGIETLEITDCTEVTQDAMVEALEKLMPAGLRALILTHAGRCFGSKAVSAILQSSSFPTSPALTLSGSDTSTKIPLFALSISGAYLLKDLDASKIIASSSSTLSSIAFTACPLIRSDVCHSLATHYASGADGSLLLELSLNEIPLLSNDNLKSLFESSDCLRNLKNLTLRQMDGVDDVILDGILSQTSNLQYLDIGLNVNVTDHTLSTIRRYNINGTLQNLNLSGLKNLTAIGLETFFTFGIEGLPPPPRLRVLDLSDCHFDAVNDNVMILAIAASSLKRVESAGDAILNKNVEDDKKIASSDMTTETDEDHGARRNEEDNCEENNIITSSSYKNLSALGGFIDLDLSGSAITDVTMEALASNCATSLSNLKVNFCSQVSNQGLGYLVSKCGRQFSSLELWGCAQISDLLLDGHDRINDGAFVVEGAWMKPKIHETK